jgi:hypothetical protein
MMLFIAIFLRELLSLFYKVVSKAQRTSVIWIWSLLALNLGSDIYISIVLYNIRARDRDRA